MLSNTTGSNNTALGYQAGTNLTTGSNNIDIASLGLAADNNAIRLGRRGVQTASYIAGISGASVIGSDVVVNSAGRLGVVVSSARFKRDIRDMGEKSAGLKKLRPVTFRYKDDQTGTLQYGLVAEEVARTYPELVTHGADGKVETVRYSMLTSMLLNELQKQTIDTQRQTHQLQQETEQLQRQETQLRRQAEQIKRLAVQESEDRRERMVFEVRFTILRHAMHGRNGASNVMTAFDR
jgi:hypothetical protein